MDWHNTSIILDQEIDPQLLYIAIYVDLNYYNNCIVSLDNGMEKRMIEHKEQSTPEMYMSSLPKD
jgi:hypothetical protein